MDDLIRESLAGFDSVWQRVTGQGEEKPADRDGPDTYPREDALMRLIHDEACASADAASLARMCQGDSRALLLRHAADARRHLRRLRAEYFIASGAACPKDWECRPAAGRLEGLRRAFLRAQALAERYASAAEQTACGELREALAAFAADERRIARETRALLIESF